MDCDPATTRSPWPRATRQSAEFGPISEPSPVRVLVRRTANATARNRHRRAELAPFIGIKGLERRGLFRVCGFCRVSGIFLARASGWYTPNEKRVGFVARMQSRELLRSDQASVASDRRHGRIIGRSCGWSRSDGRDGRFTTYPEFAGRNRGSALVSVDRWAGRGVGRWWRVGERQRVLRHSRVRWWLLRASERCAAVRADCAVSVVAVRELHRRPRAAMRVPLRSTSASGFAPRAASRERAVVE